MSAFIWHAIVGTRENWMRRCTCVVCRRFITNSDRMGTGICSAECERVYDPVEHQW